MANSIKDIILSLTKTVKAIKMYGVNHPSAQNFYKPFYHKISDYLDENPELNFQIEQTYMLHAGKIVYSEKEKDKNITFPLFRDGIRNINFAPGITYDELLQFLDTISQMSKEQDIALNLWECHFDHIDFYVVEEEDEELLYKTPELPVQDIDYDAKISEIINRENIDLNATFETELTDQEVKDLKNEITINQKVPIVTRAITTLMNYLKHDKSKEIINSLIELLEQCVVSGYFHDARRIVHRLNQYPSIDPIDRFENEETIMGFSTLINTASEDIFNEFIAFVGFFSKESIHHFMKLMGVIKRQERLMGLRNRIVHLAQGDVKPLANLLSSKDNNVLINTIAVMGLMRSDETVSLLEPLLDHLNQEVKIEIISALENCDSAPHIAKFLDDTSSDVRIKALQALARIRYPKIYTDLLRGIKSKEFRHLEFIEQKEHFNCLVSNGSKTVTRDLKKILFKWLLFRRKQYSVMRKLAAMALSIVNSDEALAILHSGIKKRNKDIQQACKMALKQK